MRKILVVVGNPPGVSNVGEIILRDMIAAIPEFDFHVFGVFPKRYDRVGAVPSTLKQVYNFDESPYRTNPMKLWGRVYKSVYTFMHYATDVRKAEDAVVAYAQKVKPDDIWIILNFPPIIAMAQRLVERLNIPCRALVWDDPEYLTEHYKYDRFSRKAMLKSFGACLASAKKVAVVSQEMCEEYGKRWGVNCCIVRHGIPAIKPDALDESKPDEVAEKSSTVKIGFSGSLYVISALYPLLRALDSVDWKIQNRPVELILLGNRFELYSSKRANIQFLGFRNSPELENILSNCDLLYQVYPFEPFLRRLSTLSFPTKLSTYMALGKPVFAHGPDYAVLNRFMNETGCGVFCNSQQSDKIIEFLEFILSPSNYSQAVNAVTKTYEKYFSATVFQESFRDFWGLDSATDFHRLNTD